MYELIIEAPDQKQAEHLELAMKMAKEITEKFTPDLQNEMIRKMRHIIIEHRQQMVEEAEKNAIRLNNTLQDLIHM